MAVRLCGGIQFAICAALTMFALVNVLAAVDALVAGGARAGVGTVDGAGVADGVLVAGVGGARVVQVAQQTCGKTIFFAIKLKPQKPRAANSVS
jgi:hypothetical protein